VTVSRRSILLVLAVLALYGALSDQRK